MQATTALTINRLVDAPDGAARGQWLVHGAPMGQPVAGAYLEAAFQGTVQTGPCWLAFVTHDIAYEEALSIYLLGHQCQTLDLVTLSGVYSSGRFALLGPQEPDAVQFRFIGDTDWTVKVLPAARPHLPFFSDPRGVWRPLGFRRQLVVLGKPKPQER